MLGAFRRRICRAWGGLRRRLRSTGYSKLVGGSALHITLLYFKVFVRDDLGGFFGVLLLRACPAGGFRDGLSILRLSKSNCGKKGCRQYDRQSKAQCGSAKHSATPHDNQRWINSQDTLAERK